MRTRIAACLVALAAIATSAAADPIEAYKATITTGTTGNGKGRQTLQDSVLGLDFQVTTVAVTISQLGIWDDNGDGLSSAHSLMIYDLNNPGSPLAQLNTLPGTGTLIGGYRYFDLPTPLTLILGTQFTIAVYYPNGNADSNGNGGATPPRPNDPTPIFTDGHGLARYWRGGFAFPGTLDTGPANRYHSGSFTYSPNPEPGTMILLSGALAAAGAWRRRRVRQQR